MSHIALTWEPSNASSHLTSRDGHFHTGFYSTHVREAVSNKLATEVPVLKSWSGPSKEDPRRKGRAWHR